MKAVFRVDASATIGSGHLSRCLTLARALGRAGAEIAIASRDPSEHTRGWIAREGHGLVLLGGAREAEATREAAGDAELVIVDGYTFGADVHDAVRRPGRIVAVVDDTGEAPVRADVVLNGNLFGEAIAYPDVPTRLLGPSYALVRDEFAEARARDGARAAGDGRRVLVTMGGADPAGATEAFLAALDAAGPAIAPCDVTVVVGGANPRAGAIREASERPRGAHGHRIGVQVDVLRMSDLMIEADVAVVAAGSTCLELACLGVPAVVVAVADNQEPVAAEVARRGLMASVGRFGPRSGAALVAAMDALLRDRPGRQAAIDLQRATVDGVGATRAAAALLALASALRP
ncbi:MAG: UDP-2,4-diacetamido-2,4,6-trideoxy-beta-L-altropyranose hydrolase [Deltaproteobacteria bacterium]|nr:UDP-2,4-diacetamido-2,4,6-trideoxy-beta-L-altropyranose hydrolase [Deltaproteobacteria bacterium]